LFSIGYGPTPSKRKDIVLEQEVERGFELLLHKVWKSSQGFSLYSIERENPFEEKLLVYKVSKRAVVHFQVSGRCGKDFLKML
jgi:hypothetical protein